MEYIFDVSIVCGLIKTQIFSQEIFHKERIPAGSREEKTPWDEVTDGRTNRLSVNVTS